MEKLIASCYYLGRVLQTPPDEGFIAQTLELAREEEIEELAGIMACLEKGADTAAEIPRDHLRLFSGPDPLAPPWESVWVEKDHLLFGDVTASVAQLYEAWGMEISGQGREPQDHLGLELVFLAHVLECQQEGFAPQGVSAAESAREIIKNHILRFAPQVLQTALEQASTEYYRQVCQAALALLPRLVSNCKNKDINV